jgi:glycosyltransferase involved in cell wall biosynthesis
MRLWANLFHHVTICSPAGEGEPRIPLVGYDRPNVTWVPVKYSGRQGGLGAMIRLCQLPIVCVTSHKVIRHSDFLLFRSPDHIGFVGAILSRLMGRDSITKWAGDRGPRKGEPISVMVDRLFQDIPSRHHHILVYGKEERRHHISFFPALMSSNELAAAQGLTQNKSFCPPWKILMVGRLEPGKGFDLALQGLRQLRDDLPNLPWECTVVGDGSQYPLLKEIAAASNVRGLVRFTGPLPFEKVQEEYANSHFLVMPSTNEGWPKVIAEAWAHGCLPIAAPARLVPWILRRPGSGVIFDPSPAGLSRAIREVCASSGQLATLSKALFSFAAELSLDNFQRQLERVLVERCGLR